MKAEEIAHDRQTYAQMAFATVNMSNVYIFGVIKEHYNQVKPIYQLVVFIIERFNAVSQLAIHNMEWDAEIVLRSGLEAFAKLLYITDTPDPERELLLKEYWEDFAELTMLKQSEQAKKNLRGFGNVERDSLYYKALLLDEERENELKAKWPKSKRKPLEQKWSFTEILNSAALRYRNPVREMLLVLSHTYKMASHVTHGDETGVGIIEERKKRSEEDRLVANAAHFFRLMSDCVTYPAWTGLQVSKFLGKTDMKYFDFVNILKSMDNIVERYEEHQLRDPGYNKFR